MNFGKVRIPHRSPLMKPKNPWAEWAGLQSKCSAVLLLLSSVLGFFAGKPALAAVNLAISLLVLVLENAVFLRLEKFDSFLLQNFYFRGAIYSLLAIPSFFLVSTVAAGLCLLIGSFLFLAAALKNGNADPKYFSSLGAESNYKPKKVTVELKKSNERSSSTRKKSEL